MKNKQIPFPHWLDEHIREVCKMFDISYGAVVRMYMSVGINTFCQKAGWEDAKTTDEGVERLVNEILTGVDTVEGMEHFASKALFYCRRGLEWRTNHLIPGLKKYNHHGRNIQKR